MTETKIYEKETDEKEIDKKKIDKKKIGVGLIGTGFMAKVHSNAYHTMKYIYYENHAEPELVSICSESSLERAKDAGRRYGFLKAGVGYREVIADPDVDVVDICNGDFWHKKIAMDALAAGKHVICEKPLATNQRDAKELYEFAKTRSQRAFCGFNYRFIPAVLLARQLIDSGVMGRPYSFNGSYLQDVGAFEETPYEKLWYASGPKSSGVSYGIGGHLIDLSRFLMGEIAEVSGMVQNYNPTRMSADGPRKVESEEDAVAAVSFAGGAMGTLRFSTAAAGRKNCLRFEISCSKGTLLFDLEEINYLWVFHKDSPLKQVSGFTKVNVTQVDRDHPFMDVWWPRGHGIGWEHAHINQLACCLEEIARTRTPEGAARNRASGEALRRQFPGEPGEKQVSGKQVSGKPAGELAASFYDGYQAIRVADGIRESSETGTRILL